MVDVVEAKQEEEKRLDLSISVKLKLLNEITKDVYNIQKDFEEFIEKINEKKRIVIEEFMKFCEKVETKRKTAQQIIESRTMRQ